jgi:hypothetical protein
MLFINSLVLTGCFDLIEWKYWSDENYSVTINPGTASSKTLYYDLENNNAIGRVDFVKRIGSNKKYIIVESTKSEKDNTIQYCILNKEKDSKYLNGDEIMEGPYSLLNFNKKKKELGISQLYFTNEFK